MAGHEVDPPDDRRYDHSEPPTCIDCVAPLSDIEAKMYGNRCETCEQVWFDMMQRAKEFDEGPPVGNEFPNGYN